MAGFFRPLDTGRSIRPLEGFPVAFGEGTLSAVVSTDELSSVVFLHSLVASALDGEVYVISQGRKVSPLLIERLGVEPSNLLVGFAYSADELKSALGQVSPGSLVVVSDFPPMDNINEKTALEIRRVTDERGLITVLHHEAITFNELDPASEFERLFFSPGLFDLLLVLRTNSYRGHHKLNVTLLKAPPEDFWAVGDHSIPIDGILRKLRG